MQLARLKPAVSRRWLLVTAGAIWSVVGIYLCKSAYQWLNLPNQHHAVWIGIGGALSSLLTYHFLFSKIAAKNIRRLVDFPEKGCFFAFQTWKSYLNIIVMIGLGTLLRHSPLPRSYLSVIYTAIGGGLFLASLGYYRHI